MEVYKISQTFKKFKAIVSNGQPSKAFCLGRVFMAENFKLFICSEKLHFFYKIHVNKDQSMDMGRNDNSVEHVQIVT